MAANVSLPNTLVNGQPNDASQVMADLNALVTWINTNAVHLDGTKAMTGNLASPGTDPASANEYARKAYVDAGDLAPLRVGVSATRASQSVANTTTATITFDAEAWDTDGFFAPSSTTITVPAGRAGLYVVGAFGSIPGFVAFRAAVLLNGVIIFTTSNAGDPQTAPVITQVVGTRLMPLAVADALTMQVWHQTGGAANVTAALSLARLSL